MCIFVYIRFPYSLLTPGSRWEAPEPRWAGNCIAYGLEGCEDAMWVTGSRQILAINVIIITILIISTPFSTTIVTTSLT